MLRAEGAQARVRVPHKYSLDILEPGSWARQPIKWPASLTVSRCHRGDVERQPWPRVGEGGLGTEMGSPAGLLSESTEKFVSGCLQRFPSAARRFVSGGGRTLDGLTNVPLAPPPSLPMGRPVAGFCLRARPWRVLAWLPPREIPGVRWAPGNCPSQKTGSIAG